MYIPVDLLPRLLSSISDLMEDDCHDDTTYGPYVRHECRFCRTIEAAPGAGVLHLADCIGIAVQAAIASQSKSEPEPHDDFPGHGARCWLRIGLCACNCGGQSNPDNPKVSRSRQR